MTAKCRWAIQRHSGKWLPGRWMVSLEHGAAGFGLHRQRFRSA
jgi:hypothetical protein